MSRKFVTAGHLFESDSRHHFIPMFIGHFSRTTGVAPSFSTGPAQLIGPKYQCSPAERCRRHCGETALVLTSLTSEFGIPRFRVTSGVGNGRHVAPRV